MIVRLLARVCVCVCVLAGAARDGPYPEFFCPDVYLYKGLSTIFFYLTWRVNGSADLHEI